jgi:glycine cleavage system H lipoate-binding protein
MSKAFLILLLFASVSYGFSPASYGQQQKRIAIINTVDDEDPSIWLFELNILADRLREIASKTLPQSRYILITHQKAADYVVQCHIKLYDGSLNLKVELYENEGGALVSSFVGLSKDVHGLLLVINEKAPDMFEKINKISYGQKRIAIINTVDDEDPSVWPFELNILADRLREIASKTLPQSRYILITHQRAADYVVQWHIKLYDGSLNLKVDLYENEGWTLVSSFVGISKDVHGLLLAINEKAPDMFEKINIEPPASKVKSDKIIFGIGGAFSALGTYDKQDQCDDNDVRNFFPCIEYKIGLLMNIPLRSGSKQSWPLNFNPEIYYTYRKLSPFDTKEHLITVSLLLFRGYYDSPIAQFGIDFGPQFGFPLKTITGRENVDYGFNFGGRLSLLNMNFGFNFGDFNKKRGFLVGGSGLKYFF